MKTDYAALGIRALTRLRKTCKNAHEIQKDLLFEILKKNKDTEFGKKHNFSEIRSIEEFKEKIPLSDYSDYAEDINRIINGEKNVLTSDDPIYFCISSGTTGDEKHIPVTGADVKIQYLYDYGLVFGAVREYYSDLEEKEIFGKIFQIGEFGRTNMPDGRIKGIRSGCVYLCAEKYGGFDASDYCAPKEILFPDTLEDQLYIKIRFALAERDLTAIHGVFINRAAVVMDHILQNWDMLINDIEKGTITAAVNKKQRNFLMERLPPDPERAEELRAIPRENISDGLVRKIWKNMKYILSIGGVSLPYYTEKMRRYAGDVPICHYAYASSEGVFGVSEKMNVSDRYILFPEAGFFEFIPVKKPQKTLLMQKVKIGEKYQLIFTSRSGLYRYCQGDVAEVVGFYGEAPVIRYCYRINQAINIAGEKTNCEQLSAAMKNFSEITGTGLAGYCVCEDNSGLIPKYLFYIECEESGGICNAENILEECMCEANFDYCSCRKMNEIAHLKLLFLRRGSFCRYEKKLEKTGKAMGQSKQLHFLDTDEKKKFFSDQIIGRGTHEKNNGYSG